MSTQPSSPPPDLPGYSPVRFIGGGGFADVFVYEQHMPNRHVAVKVLKGAALEGEGRRRQFAAEANLMAKVSTHPYIVTIFHADVAVDGRPYIVMEFYPGQNFLERARTERFAVAEALRVCIQVGSALETAHKAGILHRDVKPANILTSEFRRPGLTDFGIASAHGGDDADLGGVSIPWSPPEAFGDEELGVGADVYSLAATLFHFLTGHSPFEVPAGDNSPLALMRRIEHDPLPSLGRPDAPSSLQRLLSQAMAKRPNHRPASMVDFLRQLQAIETELKLAVTPLELADTAPLPRPRVIEADHDDDEDERTRVRGVTEIRPREEVRPRNEEGAIGHVPENPTGMRSLPPRRREGMLAAPEVAQTVPRPARVESTVETGAVAAPEPDEPRRRRIGAYVGAAVLVAAAGVGIAVAGSGGADDPSTTAEVVVTDAPMVKQIEPVTNLVGTRQADGSVLFTWDATGVQQGDAYDLVPVVDSLEQPKVRVTDTEFSVPGAADSTVCVWVTAWRAGSSPAKPQERCVP